VNHRSRAELIAEAEQAFAAAKRLVDEQSAIVQRLERTGGCNSEAVDLLNNLRELLAARERRLARVRSWPFWNNDHALSARDEGRTTAEGRAGNA
jgi:hypothetical protein